MGARQSTPAPESDSAALKMAMANVQRSQGGVVGGGSSVSYFGGNEKADPAKGLREYESSYSARAKEDTLRRLATALNFAGLKLNLDVDADKLAEEIVKVIPNPKTNGRSFTSDANSQANVCKVIANVLNNEFSPGATKPESMFIDTTLSPQSICREVSNWGMSFLKGVNTEFLAVHASVRNAMKSIITLDEIMKNIYERIIDRVNRDGSSELKRELESLNEVYRRAQSERLRQEEMLKNILNIQLMPAAQQLEIALRDESEQNALIKKLGLKPGTSEFADSIAAAISGLGTAATIAHRVNKALKAVGVSVRQYLDSADYKAFQKMLDEKVESGHIKSADLAEFLRAAQTLRDAFSERSTPAFREVLEEANKSGGADEPYMSTMDRRVQKVKAEKTVIVRDFVNRMSRHYDEVLTAVESIGPELGKKIPLTDKTDMLRDAIVRLQDMREARIELALVGLYTDAAARERKERFLGALRQVSEVCSMLMELEMYRNAGTYLAHLKAAIEALGKTVDYFSKVMAEKFGGEEEEYAEEERAERFGGRAEEERAERFGGKTERAEEERAERFGGKTERAEEERAERFGGRAEEERAERFGGKTERAEEERAERFGGKTERAEEERAERFGGKERAEEERAERFGGKTERAEEERAERFGGKTERAEEERAERFGGRTEEERAERFGGRAERAEEERAERFGGKTERAERVERLGGADDDLLPEIARSALSLQKAVAEFRYYYFVARIRSNMSQSAKELDSFGEKYVDMLGDAVAARLRTLETTRKAIEATLAAVPVAQVSEEQKTEVKKWVNLEYKTKNDFYRVVQAMDLYMKAFTSGIVKDPDAVRDIKTMLEGTQVIARWFSDSTGDALWRAFECMGTTDFVGAKFNPAANTAGTVVRGSTTPDHYYDKVAAAIAAPVVVSKTSFGIPELSISLTTPTTPTNSENAKKEVDNTIEFFQGLKNLVNAFSRIGDRFGGSELRTKIFMSPAQIYKTLTTYLKQSAMSVNAGTGAAAVGIPVDIAYGMAQVPNGVEPYQVYFSAVAESLKGNYDVEDKYFVMIIKSMAAKVLTTLGVFDMFERRTPIQTLTPTRIIVGGDDSAPDVVEGATELYFRLPRLVEFYRTFLRWDGQGDLRISMLPEVEGVFSGIIRLIFQKVSSPDTGDYSDTEMQSVIREVNTIYMHFHEKDGERAVSSALSALIMEVNRRYGVIASQDMKKYWEEVRRSGITGTFGSYNDTNYAILPGENENEVDRRAPSDRFAVPGSSPSSGDQLPRNGRPDLDTDFNSNTSYYYLLRKMRDNLESQFSTVMASDYASTSYSLLIKQAESEIRRAGSKESKLMVAMKLIQGTNVVGLDANKTFMFHETVVVGLNTLSALYTLVKRYSDLVSTFNPIRTENDIIDILLRRNGNVDITRLAIVAAILDIDRRYIVGDGVSLRGRGLIDNNAVTSTTLLAGWNAYAGGAGAAGIGNAIWPDNGPKPSSLTEEQINGRPADQRPAIRAARLTARLMVDYNLMMNDLIENVFDLIQDSNGLVEVRFPMGSATAIHINFSKLRQTAESILADVKNYFDTFRPFIAKNILDRFESIGTPGSIFWIENKLVDEIFRGKDDTPENQALTLDGISRRTAVAFNNLTRDTMTVTLRFASVFPATDPEEGRDEAQGRYETYSQALSAMVYYNGTSPNSGVNVPAVNARAGYSIGNLVGLTPAAGRGELDPVLAFGQRLRLYSDENDIGMTQYRSLMFAFNQLLAQYLAVLSDPSGARKIYLTLINSYANGVASNAVNTPRGSSHPDITTAVVFGQRGDPKNGAVLLQSLAFILYHLVKDVNPNTQISEHLVTTLTDVPLFLKESFRVNLPGFIRLFSLIAQKGDFIKQILQKTRIRCFRLPQVAAAATKIVGQGDGNFAPGSLDAIMNLSTIITNSDEMKSRLTEIIDAISTSAYTLASSASDVLKELGDRPVYFQTQENSIETYKLRYGRLPLMPLSLTLYYLSNLRQSLAPQDLVDDVKLFPKVRIGQPDFKMQYGVRGLLIRSGVSSSDLDQMPGVRASLEAYNGVSSKREQLDVSRYQNFVRNIVASLRFITDARNYKSMLSTSSRIFSLVPLVGADNGFAIRIGLDGNASFAIDKDSQRVVNVVEASDQEDTMQNLVSGLGGMVGNSGQNGSGRKRECILNLIDMNQIPINVHALMRDIPLANLYNYETTYEQMLASIYGELASSYTNNPLARRDDIRSAHQMLIRLLINPYLDLSRIDAATSRQLYGSDSYTLGTGGYVHRIFRGDNDTGLGRPKFLSDQLFNKALFGSVYKSRDDYDEGGPGVGSGIERGRGGVTVDARFSNVQLDNTNISYLTTPGDAPSTAVHTVDVTTAVIKERLEAIGRMRFDTRLVRNLFFITNVLRLLRLKLNRELTFSRNVLVNSHASVASNITEYGSDPFTPNEVIGSSIPVAGLQGGLNRFNDRDAF